MVWIILSVIAFSYFWTFSMARAASKRSRSEEYWEGQLPTTKVVDLQQKL